jgi:outer membrane protein OmpA-like peptidoglycan-associated protein
VVVDAANWAERHPDMPVIVASYTDPYGGQKANADFTRLRAQVVSDGLVANGVLASRIERREILARALPKRQWRLLVPNTR